MAGLALNIRRKEIDPHEFAYSAIQGKETLDLGNTPLYVTEIVDSAVGQSSDHFSTPYLDQCLEAWSMHQNRRKCLQKKSARLHHPIHNQNTNVQIKNLKKKSPSAFWLQ